MPDGYDQIRALVGCCVDGEEDVHQFLARRPQDEEAMLRQFCDFALSPYQPAATEPEIAHMSRRARRDVPCSSTPSSASPSLKLSSSHASLVRFCAAKR
jgi:hypothetical protein